MDTELLEEFNRYEETIRAKIVLVGILWETMDDDEKQEMVATSALMVVTGEGEPAVAAAIYELAREEGFSTPDIPGADEILFNLRKAVEAEANGERPL